MNDPFINWLYFLGFLGVVLAVIFFYWKLLDWLFDVAKARRMRADRAEFDRVQREMEQIDQVEQRRKVLNAAISWKVKPR